MKYLFSLFFLLFSLSLTAQQAVRQVVGCLGGSSTASGTTMSFTAGEAVVGSHQTNGAAIIKGFQRPIQLITPQRFGQLPTAQSLMLSELYPNPASTQAFLHYQAEDATVSIYSMKGQLLWSQKLEQKEGILSLPIDNLTEGMYIVSLTNAERKSTHKLIITR